DNFSNQCPYIILKPAKSSVLTPCEFAFGDLLFFSVRGSNDKNLFRFPFSIAQKDKPINVYAFTLKCRSHVDFIVICEERQFNRMLVWLSELHVPRYLSWA